MTAKLMPDAKVPALSVPTVGGGQWDLASQTPANFTMVVVYRGYHCPLCKTYLGKLNDLAAGYRDAGFSVLTVSMDSLERATKTKDEWGLSNLTVGYGLSEATARAWGLWISSSIKEAEAPTFAEPGLFWVRPTGELYLVDISNMPFARPDLELLLSKVQMVVDNGYPARGTMKAAA
ncbi:MAG: redoxin domain-containing protein [Pseudomonadota bacterium]